MQGLNDSVRHNLANEVRLLASVQHPNIVKLYEAFVDLGSLCLVMELLPSPDLSHLIRCAAPASARSPWCRASL